MSRCNNRDAVCTIVPEWMEDRMRWMRTRVTPALRVVYAIYLILGYGLEMVWNMIGFAYPAYGTIKAIGSKSDRNDDLRWLIYWSIFATLCAIEKLPCFFVEFKPLYYKVKYAFLIWCFLPIHINGSHFFYKIFYK